MNNNIQKYLDNNPDNPKYLFHGSPVLMSELEPQQSRDSGGNQDNVDCAVFMYPVFYKCVPYALKRGFIYKEEFGEDSWFETYNRTIDFPYAVLNNRDIDMDAIGYLYVFEKNDDMIKDPLNYQYRCYHSLKPIDVVQVQMKDYVDLFEIRNSSNRNIK
ncbi:MAG: hypothetical protein E7159_03860 [Firmicutes bacterium]|nr:hypothetical protein [Bacillota bacterium]